MINLAINGFGRIGRQAFKVAINKKDIKIVAINDLTDTKTLAHLLKHDTAYGQYDKKVEFDEKNLIVDGKKFRFMPKKIRLFCLGVNSKWMWCWNAPAVLPKRRCFASS